MTSDEVRAIVESEIGDDRSLTNPHGVVLETCLVSPRLVRCQSHLFQADGGHPVDLWVVLEERPGKKDGYLIVYDERNHQFGLGGWSGGIPAFLGHHGTFLNTVAGI